MDDPPQLPGTNSDRPLSEWSIRCTDPHRRIRTTIVQSRVDATVTPLLPDGEWATIERDDWLHLREGACGPSTPSDSGRCQTLAYPQLGHAGRTRSGWRLSTTWRFRISGNGDHGSGRGRD